jgi:Ni,Fe-hydrogenase III small subunit/ferredoxin
MAWVFRGLRDGVLTTAYPRRPDPYLDSVRAVAVPVPGARGGLDVLPVCPTGAISREAEGTLRVDRGRCIACGLCTDTRPDLFRWAGSGSAASAMRSALVVPELPGTEEQVRAAREELSQRTRRLRRSVHVRHVDAGSDGADEWEVLALLNPVYDVHRLGIFFTASPRHADVLLVTGAGAHGMAAPLRRTQDAMPRPTVVIAAGTDAISGGLVAPTYAVAGGIGGIVPVDVWIAGSPPSPFSLLIGLLLAVDRLPAARSGRAGRTG